MPPIEVGSTSPPAAVSARFTRAGGPASAESTSPSARPESPTVDAASSLDPGAAPIDGDRVTLIRKAVENGTYPIIPAQIADAMIAAGVLLRNHHE